MLSLALLLGAPVLPESPPRVDGLYLGGGLHGGAALARVDAFETDPFFGGGGNLDLGAALFPFMTLGFEGRGAQYFSRRGQQLFQGGLLVVAGFYPARRWPLSLRAGLGFGLGFAVDRSQPAGRQRSSLGFPQFLGSARYEFFPGAARRRPNRPGGFAIGPEIGWRGFTPSRVGRPMANTFFVAVWLGYYFGR